MAAPLLDKTLSTMSLSIVEFGAASSLLFRSAVTIDSAEAALSSPSDLGSPSVLLLSSLFHHHRAYVVGKGCISKFEFLLFFGNSELPAACATSLLENPVIN